MISSIYYFNNFSRFAYFCTYNHQNVFSSSNRNEKRCLVMEIERLHIGYCCKSNNTRVQKCDNTYYQFVRLGIMIGSGAFLFSQLRSLWRTLLLFVLSGTMYKYRLLKDCLRLLHLDTRQHKKQREHDVRMAMLTQIRINMISSVIRNWFSSIVSSSFLSLGVMIVNVEFSWRATCIICWKISIYINNFIF